MHLHRLHVKEDLPVAEGDGNEHDDQEEGNKPVATLRMRDNVDSTQASETIYMPKSYHLASASETTYMPQNYHLA